VIEEASEEVANFKTYEEVAPHVAHTHNTSKKIFMPPLSIA